MARPEADLPQLLRRFAVLAKADQQQILRLLPDEHRRKLLARVESLAADRAEAAHEAAFSPWLAGRIRGAEGAMTDHARAVLKRCAAELRVPQHDAAELAPRPGVLAWLRRSIGQ
ncbi:MAG: hypothetical protein JSS36_01290 [Proteobacteria bacterium]|nr:hypothetical protein [Pseudomonadota bacterium]